MADLAPRKFADLLLPGTVVAQCAPELSPDIRETLLEDGPGRFKRSQGRVTLTDIPPPDRDWAIEGLLLASSVTVLAGLGGVSKTMLAIVWAVHTALGRDWAGRETISGCAALFLGEESPEEVSRRLNAVCIALGLTDDEKRLVERRILVFGLAGEDIRLTTFAGGNPMPTEVVEDIVQVCQEQEFASAAPMRLVVLDHAKLIMAGDPNAAADVTALTRTLTDIARNTGASLLLLAHSPKASIGSEGKATVKDVAGNAAFVDNARIGMTLRTMREDEGKSFGINKDACGNYALLENFKNNYAATGDVTWLVRRNIESHKVAVPLPVILTEPPKAASMGTPALDAKLIEFIAASPGLFTRTKLRDSQSGKKDGRFKASKSEIDAAIDRLISNGMLVNRPVSQEEREKLALHSSVKFVLEVPKR